MQEFLSNLSQISWWLSVVFIGVLINIVSPFISKYFGNAFKWWGDKRRAEEQKEEELGKAWAMSIQEDIIQQTFYQFLIQHERIRSLRFLLFAIVFYLIGSSVVQKSGEQSFLLSTLLYLIGSFAFVISSNTYLKSIKMMEVLIKVMNARQDEKLVKVKKLSAELNEEREKIKNSDVTEEKLDLIEKKLNEIKNEMNPPFE